MGALLIRVIHISRFSARSFRSRGPCSKVAPHPQSPPVCTFFGLPVLEGGCQEVDTFKTEIESIRRTAPRGDAGDQGWLRGPGPPSPCRLDGGARWKSVPATVTGDTAGTEQRGPERLPTGSAPPCAPRGPGPTRAQSSAADLWKDVGARTGAATRTGSPGPDAAHSRPLCRLLQRHPLQPESTCPKGQAAGAAPPNQLRAAPTRRAEPRAHAGCSMSPR